VWDNIILSLDTVFHSVTLLACLRAIFDALGTTVLLVEIIRAKNKNGWVDGRLSTLYSRIINEGACGGRWCIAQFIQVRSQRPRTWREWFSSRSRLY
jgi:hypothetical protein